MGFNLNEKSQYKCFDFSFSLQGLECFILVHVVKHSPNLHARVMFSFFNLLLNYKFLCMQHSQDFQNDIVITNSCISRIPHGR